MFAFVLAMSFLAVGSLLIVLGHDVAGATVAATSSVSLAIAFLGNSRRASVRPQVEHSSDKESILDDETAAVS